MYTNFFVFVPVKNVFSAACGNNQITYSHWKEKKSKKHQKYFDAVGMSTDL